MTEVSYPTSVDVVVTTLAEMCRYQGRADLVTLIENANAFFDQTDYDNWNGGTYTWALRLEIPVQLFAENQDRLTIIEEELKQKLAFLNRRHPNNPLGEVTITPIVSGEAALGQRIPPSDIDVRRLWPHDYFRLFLSHVSRHKIKVSALKTALLEHGIAAFVAHEDIEPNSEWQAEISLALRSMHTLAALVTTDFHESKWTDQEVGWALGIGVPVLVLRLGADPYGFIGKMHAISGTLDDPVTLATHITRTLLRDKLVRGTMRNALIGAFERSGSFATAKRLKDLIVELVEFSEAETERIKNACSRNQQIAGAYGVCDAIYRNFGPPKPAEVISDEIPF